MSSMKDKYIEEHPEKFSRRGCEHKFGLSKCTSGSNPKDDCNYDYDKSNCPYRD